MHTSGRRLFRETASRSEQLRVRARYVQVTYSLLYTIAGGSVSACSAVATIALAALAFAVGSGSEWGDDHAPVEPGKFAVVWPASCAREAFVRARDGVALIAIGHQAG